MMKKPTGLTDREQAIVVLLSGVLIALGAVTIPADIPYHIIIGVVLALIGAFGLALKEWAGGAISFSQATVDTLASGVKALVDYQNTKNQPAAPAPPPVDKTKLFAEIMSMAQQAVENATATATATPDASAAPSSASSPS